MRIRVHENLWCLVGHLLPSAAMKLFGPLFAGAAALSGVTGTTCPAGDVFSEMTKEDMVRALFMDDVPM